MSGFSCPRIASRSTRREIRGIGDCPTQRATDRLAHRVLQAPQDTCSYRVIQRRDHRPGLGLDPTVGYLGPRKIWYNLVTNEDLLRSIGAWLLRHIGNDPNVLATRVSYELDLVGPSMNVQTACSSSLVARRGSQACLLAPPKATIITRTIAASKHATSQGAGGRCGQNGFHVAWGVNFR
jgi:hypothetical protein